MHANASTGGLAPLLLLLAGCMSLGRIPATEQSAVPARYYRSQDLQYTAQGVALDQVASLALRGPTRQGRAWVPMARVGIVIAGGLTERYTDRGYREGGAFMMLVGALSREMGSLMIQLVRGRL